MSTMVEKVSAAIVSALEKQKAVLADDDQFKSVLVDQWVDITAVSRAAIEAMISPTEEMLSAGEGEDVVMANGTLVSCASALTHYEAMIEAALKEEAQ